MNDDQVIEFLRARTRVTPPLDLVASIADAVESVPQQRHSWFAPFLPAVAAVAVAGAVLMAALLVGDGTNVGPAPGTSTPFATSTSTATPAVTRSPTVDERALLAPGDSVTIDARDPSGTWGTIVLTRGDDLGGYDDGTVPEESFVIEVLVEYRPERLPDPEQFGSPDWVLVTADDGMPVGGRVRPGGPRELERPSLGTYPGAIDIFTTPTKGWLLFELPRQAADEALALVYSPTAVAEALTAIPVRDPGPPPDPVAVASPAPTPAPVTYVQQAGLPFTVIDSAEADQLFATPDTCTNPEAGYTVTYPDAWFTNTAIGDWPACSWFSPTFYDVEDPTQVPPQIAIVLTLSDGAFGFTCEPDTTVDEAVTVAGFEANRREMLGCTAENGIYTSQPAEYSYVVIVAPQPAEVPTLRAETTFEGAADYTLNKAVLDRIMALIEFDE